MVFNKLRRTTLVIFRLGFAVYGGVCGSAMFFASLFPFRTHALLGFPTGVRGALEFQQDFQIRLILAFFGAVVSVMALIYGTQAGEKAGNRFPLFGLFDT